MLLKSLDVYVLNTSDDDIDVSCTNAFVPVGVHPAEYMIVGSLEVSSDMFLRILGLVYRSSMIIVVPLVDMQEEK